MSRSGPKSALPIVLLLGVLGREAIGADPPPSYTITLGGRSACVTPDHQGHSRAEGGIIDVSTPSKDGVTAILSGGVAANAYLGTSGSASERFQLVQEFDLACSDKSVRSATLTLDSSLVGFVRSRHKAGAGIQLAAARICPIGAPDPLMVVVHPTLRAEGKDGRLCNQHLPPVELPGAPLGRYVLTADFVIDAEASGLADGHANADFSPSTSLPTDWVRTRDPFQGVDKKNFGLTVIVTASADGGAAKSARNAPPTGLGDREFKLSGRAVEPREISAKGNGFDRTIRR